MLRTVMNIVTRNSIKTLLLNSKNELLLVCTEDPKTTSIDGKSHKRFWSCIGGEMEQGETSQQALLREIEEETGITPDKIKLGPLVWFGEFDLMLSGTLTHIKQQFIVAHTTQNDFHLNNLTEEEKPIIKNLKWFPLKDIITCSDVIYPILLREHITDIIVGTYPKEPLELNLGKQPH